MQGHGYTKATLLGSISLCGLVLGLFGCSGDAIPITCESPTLALDSAMPLTEIDISGLPGGADTFTAETAAVNGIGPIEVFVQRRDDGSVFLVVPFHPADPANGGVLDIHITADMVACPPVSLTIEPLPEAPGSLDAIVGKVQEAIDLRASRFGMTSDELMSADPETLPDLLIPMWVAQTVVDHPDNPNSLRAVLAGTAPIMTDDNLNLDLLDLVIALVGGTAFLDADIAAFADVSLAPLAKVSGFALVESSPQELSAAELDSLMEQASRSARDITPDTATNKVLSDMSRAAGLLAAIPTPQTRIAGTIVGSILFLNQVYREAKAFLLPSEFVPDSLQFTYDPDLFEEDYEGAPGMWSDVLVEARSKGWKLDSTLISAIAQAAGLAGFSPVQSFTDDVVGFIINEAIAQVLARSTINFLEIEATTWPPVDISGPEWSDVRQIGDVIEVFEDAQTYEPRKVGEATLEIRTADGKFAGQQLRRSEPVSIPAIEVTLDPVAVKVENPGETITFSATVENALDEGIDWIAEPNEGSLDPVFSFGDGPHQTVYTTPTDKEKYPITIIAKSSSTGGLRGEPGAQERRGIAIVTLDRISVIVSPGGICLESGESHTFIAEVLGHDNQEVTWSADGGNITAGGRFTAGSVSGLFVITATSDEDDTAFGLVEVRIGCECFWTATLTGDFNTSLSGTVAVFTNQVVLSPTPGLVTINFWESQDVEAFPLIVLSGFGQPSEGQTGTFGDFSLFIFKESIPNFAGGGDELPIQLSVDLNEGGHMEGIITGTMLGAEVNPADPQNARELTVQINLTFRAAGFSLFGTACFK